MAVNEGTGQTELFNGWSSVVHQPCEEPEESELPSTVDMAAFTSGLSVEPPTTSHNDNSDSESDSDPDSSNSGSDASQSSSQSESSDTENSSSSSSSCSASPEFSITSSQTNVLRLKIHAVKKPGSNPPPSSEKNPSGSTAAKSEDTSSSDSPLSSDSDSESDSDNSSHKQVAKATSKEAPKKSKQMIKTPEKRDDRKSVKKDSPPKTATQKVKVKKKAKKMSSLSASRGSTYSTSDSDDSDADSAMLASCSLQEIRQEDLAAILPDQQECDAFGGFDCSRTDKSSPHAGDMSGSDMELPQQAVNALIQRTTESSSESESHAPPNPSSLYANSLLQQFVVQTQMLNTPACPATSSTESKVVSKVPEKSESGNGPITVQNVAKRKRGRPRKQEKTKNQPKSNKLAKPVATNEYNAGPNVSPDSGIPNSPDHVSSPEPNILLNRTKSKEEKKPVINASETKSKVVSDIKVKSVSETMPNKSKDMNKLPVTANRFDRLLYGNDRVLYPPRRKVGRPSVLRKGPGRPPKHKSVQQAVTDIKQSEKISKNTTLEKPIKVPVKSLEQRQSRGRKGRKAMRDASTVSNNNVNAVNGVKETVPKKSKASFLFEICERVSKRLEINNRYTRKSPVKDTKDKVERVQKTLKTKHRNRPVLVTKNKADLIKTKYTTLKNAKLMHSKHKHKKHKKCKFKILKPISAPIVDPKINLEIEKLVTDFMKSCVISTQKTPKENVSDILKTLKKVTKKRKTTEHNERKKKKQNITTAVSKDTNSNEQRLPLKKRHYHLSASNDSKVETNQVSPNQANSEEIKVDKNKMIVKASIPVCKADKPKAGNIFQKIDILKSDQSSPKHIPVIKASGVACPKAQTLNNNDYNSTLKSKGSHIDEAIEACINRFSDVKSLKPAEKSDVDRETKITTITATTPKKRHRLEMAHAINKQDIPPIRIETQSVLVEVKQEDIKNKVKVPIDTTITEIKHKRNLSPRSVTESQKKIEKKIESVAQIITRKKNRLEDLASTLVSKIIPPNPAVIDKKKKDCKEEVRVSVIKYPACKKAKPTEIEKLHTITSSKPTGIFMPSEEIDIEPPKSVKSTLPDGTKFDKEKEKVENNTKQDEAQNVHSKSIPSANQQVSRTTPESGKKKLRKRRAINRTGFPTVKKKKKKVLLEEVLDNKIKSEANLICDRVPKEGEEYTKFVERTENGESHIPKLDDPAKWEVMSECDSLPQDERTEFDFEDLKAEVKLERMNLRMRDSSPATSVDTKMSDRRDDDLDDLTLEARMERMKANLDKKKWTLGKDKNLTYHPRRGLRLRDLSPASSIERHLDRKLRDERSSTSGDENRKNKKAPRWRKKYLVAGLFSDYYKEDDETARLKRQENAAKSRFTYNPVEHPYGLLPPPYHCGKYLRCRNLPFQLPYDLWWQHTHSQLPGRDIVPSWNYRKIRTNIYNVKSTMGACEPQTCNCSTISNCGDDCINRLVLSECPASHRCQNQKIQRHEWAPGIEKFMTQSKGWGVRTKLPIKAGEFILEYVGEVVSDQEFKERMATIYVNDTHHYCLHLDGGLVIDGHRMGGDGRFVNHSCKPNCEMQKWSVNGQFRMALFALRDIYAGEELTYDYNFSLFNPAEGQECLCGSENCRGVIGGKSQRVRQLPEQVKPQPGRVGRPRKNQVAKKATTTVKEPPKIIPPPQPILPTPIVKPMSHQQKCFIVEHHCFLLRNLTKVRKVRSIASIQVSRHHTSTPTDHGVTFMNHLNALQKPRNIKTRRLAEAEDNPELNKSVKLAAVLSDVFTTVKNAKDENKKILSTSFMTLPSKRKVPEFYQRITEPIDLTTVEQNIATGIYRTLDSFNADMNRVFMTYCRFYGRTSDIGIAATRLKRIFTEAKQQYLPKFEDVLGKKPPANFISNRARNEEEDVIRCICGMYRDEGLMIQCERCLCWQHSECVKADISASYHCERCVPRPVDYEICLDEYTEHGHRYYMTLMRGELQLKQGDTVYVLRDIPIPGTDRKHTYDTIGKIEFSDLDIFRIERLWKDSKSGQRFAYGHHYLRPHETYHEPTRKFFPNEVMRVPLYEAVPVELIICHCWVMDVNTYCKGRPIGAPEEHIYICEYRVDKSARLFSKASKSKYPICTKSYAFDRFDTRLKISRTYTPHDVDPSILKSRGRKPQECEVEKERISRQVSVHVPVIKTPAEQKARLNKILLNLLSKMPTKQVLDVSYLLEGGRRRKKHTDSGKS